MQLSSQFYQLGVLSHRRRLFNRQTQSLHKRNMWINRHCISSLFFYALFGIELPACDVIMHKNRVNGRFTALRGIFLGIYKKSLTLV